MICILAGLKWNFIGFFIGDFRIPLTYTPDGRPPESYIVVVVVVVVVVFIILLGESQQTGLLHHNIIKVYVIASPFSMKLMLFRRTLSVIVRNSEVTIYRRSFEDRPVQVMYITPHFNLYICMRGYFSVKCENPQGSLSPWGHAP